MPQISKQKKDKISEQILFYLYQSFPRQLFTSDIAKEVARDEEFIKQIMIDLQKKELVIKVDKNSQGIIYQRRLRWRLSNKVHEAYSKQSVSLQKSIN
jgi:predicted transcriptional regulator with HTH domain